MCCDMLRREVPQSLVSGGVDSAVCTALLNTALGPERVVAVHIDNGFLRQEESYNVKASLEAVNIRPMSEWLLVPPL